MQPQIPMQRPVSPSGQEAVGARAVAGFSPSKGVYPKASPKQSEPDAGDMTAYGKSLGVHAVKPAVQAKPLVKSIIKTAIPVKPVRAPVKVDGKGNVMSQGGRPKAQRGTSDGSMIIRNGRK